MEYRDRYNEWLGNAYFDEAVKEEAIQKGGYKLEQ